MSLTREKVHFSGSQGRRIAGLLSAPRTGIQGWFLIAHCFTCHKNYKLINALARTLNHRGYGVLRFDFAGLGESAGAFEDTNFSTNLADFRAAAGYLRENHGGPDFLIGHSLGGSAALAIAGEISGLKGVATIGTSFQPARLKRLFQAHETAWAAAPEQVVNVRVAGREMPFKRQFVEDLARHDLESAVANLPCPLLIIHSRADEISPYENAQRIFNVATEPKKLVTLEKADHLMGDRSEAESVGEIIADWADKQAESTR